MHVPETSLGTNKKGADFYVATHSRESFNGACTAYSFGAMYFNNGEGCCFVCSGLVASEICRSVYRNQSVAKCVEKILKTMKNETI